MKKYSIITIIYNPNSTGNSQQMAVDIQRDLKTTLPNAKIRMRATKYAGHAEQITYRTALLSRHSLVVSVSGDGGYNEVVNGAMRALKLGQKITVGLIPAGNANDHYASRHRGDFVTRVSSADEDVSDIIRVRGGKKMTRYAHSYSGIGLTPQASEKLNETKLNLWQEVKIISTVLLQFKSVKLLVDGEVKRYNSLIFSNVQRMSKVIRVPEFGDNDGKMEVSHIYHRNKLKLIGDLLHIAVFGLPSDEQLEEFTFETIRRTPIQVDGEVIKIEGGTKVTIDVLKGALHSIV